MPVVPPSPRVELGRFLARYYPLARGRDRLLRSALGLDHRRIPDGFIARMDDGRRLRMRAQPPYRLVFFQGEHEPVETQLMRCIVGRGDHVLDIGANFGWFTTLLAVLVGPTGRVRAFEPVPDVVAELRFNIRENGLDERCIIHPVALGEDTGTIALGWSPEVGNTHASRPRGGSVHVEVPMRKLDDEVSAAEQPVFVKCDIEGSERHALAGGRRLFSTDPRPILLIEHQRLSDGFSDSEMIQHLRQFGYTDFWATIRSDGKPSGRLLRVKIPSALDGLVHEKLIVPWVDGMDDNPGVRNLLAFDRNAHRERLRALLPPEAGGTAP